LPTVPIKLRPQQTLKETRTTYTTLSLPALFYGSENWNIKSRYARRITAVDMKYMRNTTG
jgi:hypothetical protein